MEECKDCNGTGYDPKSPRMSPNVCSTCKGEGNVDPGKVALIAEIKVDLDTIFAALDDDDALSSLYRIIGNLAVAVDDGEVGDFSHEYAQACADWIEEMDKA